LAAQFPPAADHDDDDWLTAGRPHISGRREELRVKHSEVRRGPQSSLGQRMRSRDGTHKITEVRFVLVCVLKTLKDLWTKPGGRSYEDFLNKTLRCEIGGAAHHGAEVAAPDLVVFVDACLFRIVSALRLLRTPMPWRIRKSRRRSLQIPPSPPPPPY